MTADVHEARKAAVYEAALQLIGQGVSPAALKIQQLADAAGIGKGTVYEYFSSKDEILHGLAVYCFARENARIRALMADCATLAELEEIIADYLQDIVAERMGSYRMLAQALGGPSDGPLQCGGMTDCVQELRSTMLGLLRRLHAAGEIDPTLTPEYCCTALLSIVVGGLLGLCYTAVQGEETTSLPRNIRQLLHRALTVQ